MLRGAWRPGVHRLSPLAALVLLLTGCALEPTGFNSNLQDAGRPDDDDAAPDDDDDAGPGPGDDDAGPGPGDDDAGPGPGDDDAGPGPGDDDDDVPQAPFPENSPGLPCEAGDEQTTGEYRWEITLGDQILPIDDPQLSALVNTSTPSGSMYFDGEVSELRDEGAGRFLRITSNAAEVPDGEAGAELRLWYDLPDIRLVPFRPGETIRVALHATYSPDQAGVAISLWDQPPPDDERQLLLLLDLGPSMPAFPPGPEHPLFTAVTPVGQGCTEPVGLDCEGWEPQAMRFGVGPGISIDQSTQDNATIWPGGSLVTTAQGGRAWLTGVKVARRYEANSSCPDAPLGATYWWWTVAVSRPDLAQ